MERRRVELNVEGLFIAPGKAEYIGRRQIEIAEVFEVLENSPRFFVRIDPESGESEFSMLGRTSSGRFPLVGIEELDESEGLWRLITAYHLRLRRGQRLYEGGL